MMTKVKLLVLIVGDRPARESWESPTIDAELARQEAVVEVSLATFVPSTFSSMFQALSEAAVHEAMEKFT